MDKELSSSSMKRTKNKKRTSIVPSKNISKKAKNELTKVDNKGSIDRAEVPVEDSQKNTHVKPFLTRMNAQKLVSLVKKLDDCQQEVIKSMGFGFLFHLQSMSVSSNFAKCLVTHFDYQSCGWWFRKNQLLHLGPEDVHLTLGLPIGGSQIVEVGRGKHVNDPEYLASLKEWIEEWGKKGENPKMADMPDFILSKPGNSVSFKRNFVIYVVASLFDGPTNVYCPRSFLKNVLDVDNIEHLDWCQYVCFRVVESVKAYQLGSSTFTGPIVFMMLFYLDRMEYEGKSMIRTFPTISGWTKQSIKKRIELEEKGNGFGRGIVISRINHPIIRKNVTNVSTVQKNDSYSKDELNELSELQCDIAGLANCAKKVSTVIKEFNTYCTQMRKKYKDSRSTIAAEAIERVLQATTTIFKSYTQHQKEVMSEIDDNFSITDNVIQNIDNITKLE